MAGGMYREDGHCKGYDEPSADQGTLHNPMRATWNLDIESKKVITQAVTANNEICDDLDLVIMTHSAFGKGFMKKARISPDAFFQLAMQLAYKRDSNGKRALTYEASVTRLFAQGRTETVRSLSNESAAFVDAMLDPSTTPADRVAKLKAAAEQHANLYKVSSRSTMCVCSDRGHSFCSVWIEERADAYTLSLSLCASTILHYTKPLYHLALLASQLASLNFTSPCQIPYYTLSLPACVLLLTSNYRVVGQPAAHREGTINLHACPRYC